MRRIYREQKVTLQRMHYNPGHRKRNEQEQQVMLDTLRARLAELRNEGYEILQMDEAIFSPKQFSDIVWAPMAHPVYTPKRI